MDKDTATKLMEKYRDDTNDFKLEYEDLEKFLTIKYIPEYYLLGKKVTKVTHNDFGITLSTGNIDYYISYNDLKNYERDTKINKII